MGRRQRNVYAEVIARRYVDQSEHTMLDPSILNSHWAIFSRTSRVTLSHTRASNALANTGSLEQFSSNSLIPGTNGPNVTAQ